jgi:uncharacterized membrane protein
MSLTRAGWLTRWATTPSAQAGVAGASWSVAGSLARGLLPRSPLQQALATGIVAAAHYEATATTWAALEALVARPGTRPGVRASLAVAGVGMAAGVAVSAALGPRAATSLPAAAAATAGRFLSFAALAGGGAAAWDELLHRRLRLTPGLDTTLVPSVATGALVVGVSVLSRSRRAARYGVVAPDRHAVQHATPRSALIAGGVGTAAGVGLVAVTAAEQALAQGLERLLARIIGRDAGALGTVVAHGSILAALTAGAVTALGIATDRIQRRDDIIEPAYPEPPTSPRVSAGPASAMPFDSLGKEGRRFVLMALDAAAITAVMGEPAVDPVRVVGGFESAPTPAERAERVLQDMADVGAYDRRLIVVGVPTGVGYFNYSLAEAIEYLARGDSAIVVPQYALVPSALALTQTGEAEDLTRRVLSGIRARVSELPADRRPRVVLAGESLGANVALDAAWTGDEPLPSALDRLGVDGGLYLGVPFRTRVWDAWRADRDAVDPDGRVVLLSEPGTAPLPPAPHLMVVHHDDPVNKYAFSMVLQPPWWLGPPTTRPPLVPREVKFRPLTSFVLATVDLLNGMNSKPGTFVRRGHDYRIDVRAGVEQAFGLTCSPEQAEAIEAALREREQEWATRRMVSRKLAAARDAIEKQFREWGLPSVEVADIDPTGSSTLLDRLSAISGPPGT